MKQLTCEMCGSTDLMKQDGVFICQTCGCKYSVEEAKKMMVEGTVDVTGSTVKVDNSKELENLYQVARRAKDDDNSEQAAKYYDAILTKDPLSWEASYFSVHFKAMSCKIGQISNAASTVSNCLDTVMSLISQNVKGDENQKKAVEEVARYAKAAADLFLTASSNTFMNTDAEYRSRQVPDYYYRSFAAAGIAETLGDAISKYWQDEWACDLAIGAHDKAVSLYRSFQRTVKPSSLWFTAPIHGEVDGKASSAISRVESKKDKCRTIKATVAKKIAEEKRLAQEKRNKEYWDEHQDEKVKLESEISGYEAKIKEIEDNITTLKNELSPLKKEMAEQLPGQKDVAKEEQNKSALVTQKASLGLFKGKEKKRLQEKIDLLSTKIEGLKKIAQTQVEERKNRLQPSIDKLESEIKKMEGEKKQFADKITSIKTELTKDR